MCSAWVVQVLFFPPYAPGEGLPNGSSKSVGFPSIGCCAPFRRQSVAACARNKGERTQMWTPEAELISSVNSFAKKKRNKCFRDGDAGKGQNRRRQSKPGNKSRSEQAGIQSRLNRQKGQKTGRKKQGTKTRSSERNKGRELIYGI